MTKRDAASRKDTMKLHGSVSTRARSTYVGSALDGSRAALKSQYHATLAMLKAAVTRCSDDLWISRGGHANPYWRIAYHTLFYTHLYLQPNNRVFTPWEHHYKGIQYMGRPSRRKPYTKAEVLAYWRLCDWLVDDAVDNLRPDEPAEWVQLVQDSQDGASDCQHSPYSVS
ncbi:MAG TPA: hypothetical protein VJA65_04045 [bacterium]|nr:hypothetical protein [bacterium]